MALNRRKRRNEGEEDFEVMGTYDNMGLDDDEDQIEGDGEDAQGFNISKENLIKILGVGILFLIGILFFVLSGGDDTSTDSQQNGETEQVQQEGESTNDSENASDGNQYDEQVENQFEGVVVREQNGETYIGNENGSPINGTGAILAFDYAYYIDRDAEKVLENFGQEVNSRYDTRYVQTRIDQVAEGTDYILAITPEKVGELYDVVLTLDIPNAEQMVYNQKFQVEKVGDRFYVKTFTWERAEDDNN